MNEGESKTSFLLYQVIVK